MQDLQTMVVGGGPKTSQQGRAYFEVYLQINGQNQKTTTFDAGLYQRAGNLLNVPGATARIEQNGQYVNLKEIVGPGEQLSPLMVPGGTPVGGMGNGMGGGQAMGGAPMGGAPQQSFGQSSDARRDEINTRIAKQEATAAAAVLVGALFHGAGPEALEEAIEATLTAGKAFYEKAKGATAEPEATPDPVPTPETPQEVAEQVNEAVGTEAVVAGVPDEW